MFTSRSVAIKLVILAAVSGLGLAVAVAQQRETQKCEVGAKGYPQCVDKMTITVVTKSGKKVFRGSYNKTVRAAKAYISKDQSISTNARTSGDTAVARIEPILKSITPGEVLPWWEVSCEITLPPICTITWGGD